MRRHPAVCSVDTSTSDQLCSATNLTRTQHRLEGHSIGHGCPRITDTQAGTSHPSEFLRDQSRLCGRPRHPPSQSALPRLLPVVFPRR
ncbi:hypothetical protein A0H81_09759 [Grifola frondosa]|uniref:Uncharacterized protein n=1 Tax=Grifola frondosa TaxID=5627 RepID=A0A1C7M1M0_GRIFR|nr:hypothetical protein A0H81_09759 [Grifola frondosa]